MFKKYLSDYGSLLLASLLLFLFCTEAYFKVLYFTTGNISNILKCTKGMLLLICLFVILKKNIKSLLCLSLFSVLFIIGQYSTNLGFSEPILIYFIKFVYPIVIFLFFSIDYIQQINKKLLFSVFEYLMIFNSILILLAVVFDIQIFRTYFTSRFGYNGLIISSSSSSYIYALFLIFLITKYKKNILKKWTNYIILLAIVFVGTKALYLFSLCFVCFYFWVYSNIDKKMLLALLVTVIFLILYVFFFQIGIFNEIREQDGLISSVFSYRDRLLLEKTIPYIKENWSFTNYLFGGINDLRTKSQMEVVDVFYYFGILGGLYYLYLYLKAFFKFKSNLNIVFLLGALLFIVFLSGNFFTYSSIVIYLVILSEYLKLDDQNT
ncbi:hypothetical protein V6246_10300 [Algibacter sp. TI.3.09]|uniref:hypothetical protein n=1 Tax=Algibacter sp. TI.3.09 TaxID=3121298 RepID=UPI00311FC05A